MALAVCDDGTSVHTGSTAVGPVAGTLTTGSNSFVTIESVLVMVEDGTMEIPTHVYDLGPPPMSHSHSFSPNSLQQNYVFIEGSKKVLLGDSYTADPTAVNGAGTNIFVEVN